MGDSSAMISNMDDLLKYYGDIIDEIGDCPNIERPIAPETIFWKKVAGKNGYECQVNMIFGKCRIVSPHKTIVANGSKEAMLEKMHRLSAPDFFKPGDVIGVSRNGLFEHYGIYLGNGRVIHYCGEGGDFGGRVTVQETSFSKFIKGSKHYFSVWFNDGRPVKLQHSTTFMFGVGSLSYERDFYGKRRKVFSPDETIKRAKKRLGEEDYNLVTNNCEHFAMWCKTGVSESSQVERIAEYALKNGIAGCNLELPGAYSL